VGPLLSRVRRDRNKCSSTELSNAQILRNRGRGGASPAKEAVQAARENPARKPGAPEGNDNRARERENNPDNVRVEEYGNHSGYTLRRLPYVSTS